MMLNWKVFYIDLNFLRLILGIGNLISSHSLSAGHMPLGTGRDKVGIKALAQLMHFSGNFLFSVTSVVIRFHHVFDKSSLF